MTHLTKSLKIGDVSSLVRAPWGVRQVQWPGFISRAQVPGNRAWIRFRFGSDRVGSGFWIGLDLVSVRFGFSFGFGQIRVFNITRIRLWFGSDPVSVRVGYGFGSGRIRFLDRVGSGFDSGRIRFWIGSDPVFGSGWIRFWFGSDPVSVPESEAEMLFL